MSSTQSPVKEVPPVPVHPASPDPAIEAATIAEKRRSEGGGSATGGEVQPPPLQSKSPAAKPGTPAATTGSNTLSGRFRNLLSSARQAPSKLYHSLTQKAKPLTQPQPTPQQAAADAARATAPASAAMASGEPAHVQTTESEPQPIAEETSLAAKVMKAEGPQAPLPVQPQAVTTVAQHKVV